MWVLTMFDLPTETKLQKREYVRFRNKLLTGGFVMLQYSVYARPCPTHEEADKHTERVADWLPPEGEVRVLALTSQQFARMRVFFGESERRPEDGPDQLSFF